MMSITHKTTEDGCVEIVVTKDGFTEIGWVSSQHLTTGKELQLLRAIDRKAAASFSDIQTLEAEAMGMGPLHDA